MGCVISGHIWALGVKTLDFYSSKISEAVLKISRREKVWELGLSAIKK